MKKYPPRSEHYDRPRMEIIEIVPYYSLLQTSPGQDGQGVIPPTPNNNSDNDWARSCDDWEDEDCDNVFAE